MRSKITFVLLFMLAFTVMHDTVIHMMHKSDHAGISHYVHTDTAPQECSDMHKVHNMFHFVGIVIPYKSTFVQFQKEKTLSYDLLQYTLPHKETSYKPPIA